MTALAMVASPVAVVDRIEEDEVAVLEIACAVELAATAPAPSSSFTVLGRRGARPPPQRLPPRARAPTAPIHPRRPAPPTDTRPAMLVYVDAPLSQLPAGLREGDLVPLAVLPLPPSDVCSGNPLPHGAGEGPGSRPDTTRAPALQGTP